MKLAFLDIEAVKFNQNGKYIIRFNEHHRTESFTIDQSDGRDFVKQHIEFPLIDFGDEKQQEIAVEVIRLNDGMSIC